jgi:hypothetical protein
VQAVIRHGATSRADPNEEDRKQQNSTFRRYHAPTGGLCLPDCQQLLNISFSKCADSMFKYFKYKNSQKQTNKKQSIKNNKPCRPPGVGGHNEATLLHHVRLVFLPPARPLFGCFVSLSQNKTQHKMNKERERIVEKYKRPERNL